MKRWAYILMFGAALSVFAQSEEDGPGRGVARLSLMNGEVSVHRGDSGDVVAAALNAPLVITDRVITGPQSRAEVQFDWANMIRIGSNAEIRLSELEAGRFQIQIALGTTTFRVLRNSNADVEISTPSVSIRPLGRGVYRVTVREDGSSEIAVRIGEADIYTPGGSERLRAGGMMMARGTATDPEYQIVGAPPIDDWDHWNESRDRELERSQAYQYVSQDVYGAEDLDHYGRWTDVEGYGNVWQPTVTADWAPYRYGRWTWADYYGWTWVSYDPWGWAPYHYGRWFYANGRGWCWWPGAIRERHYWRPGLVAFFGWGSGGGGWGHVGWVPLAPHEAYHPWYGRGYYGAWRGGTVVNNTTIIANTNITTLYRNARISNGVTAVNTDVFGRRGIRNSDLVRFNSNEVQNAGLVRGIVPITPGRDSLNLADRGPGPSGLARGADRRTFFSARPTPAANRATFEQQRQGVEQVSRRTFGDASGFNRGGSATTPSMGSFPTTRGSQQPSEQGSWRRFGSPAPHEQAAPANSVERRAENGWRRFGEPGDQGMRPQQVQPQPEARTETAQPERQANRDSYRNSGGTYRDNSGSWRGNTSPAPTYTPERREAPQQRAEPRSEPRNRDFGNSQPVRISPPMVRERPSAAPAPSNNGGGGGRSFGGGGGGGMSRQSGGNSSPAPRSESHGGGDHGGGGRRGR